MTKLQNDRMTDRTKTICRPIFDLGDIKNRKWKLSHKNGRITETEHRANEPRFHSSNVAAPCSYVG